VGWSFYRGKSGGGAGLVRLKIGSKFWAFVSTVMTGCVPYN
jgi:hypothetical protein